MLRLLYALLAVMVLNLPACALDVPLTEFVLPNGLRVVVIEDHRTPVVTHMVGYRVGAADEISGKTGLAHFLEHLLFKGTTRFPYGSFERLMEVNGAESNAYTTHDYTAYYQRAAAERLPLLMEIEADRMQNLVLTDENVKPELDVVREERRQRLENEPQTLLREQSDAALFTAHPYGRPVIGWMFEVQQLTKDDALTFYRQYYTPANATVFVAGDVKPEMVKDLAEKHYGPLKNTAVVNRQKRTPEPSAIVERRIIMKSSRTAVALILKTYLTPSAKTQSGNEAEALDYVAAILGSGTQSRFHKALVLDQKLATEVGVYFSGDMLDSGKLQTYGLVAPGVSIEKLEAAMDAITAAVIKDGVTAEEVQRVRDEALALQIYALDNQFLLMRATGDAVMAGFPARQAFDTAAFEGVTRDDIQRVAKTYLRPENSVVSIMLPEVAQ